jgi:hypothetical protein
VASAGSSMGCAWPWWWTVTVKISAVSAIFVEKRISWWESESGEAT